MNNQFTNMEKASRLLKVVAWIHIVLWTIAICLGIFMFFTDSIHISFKISMILNSVIFLIISLIAKLASDLIKYKVKWAKIFCVTIGLLMSLCTPVPILNLILPIVILVYLARGWNEPSINPHT